MDYCAPLGIPHSELLNWDRSDVDKAISYNAWKNKFCGKCGTDPSDWLDEDGYMMEPPPYVSDTLTCYGCATLEEERARIPSNMTSKVTPFLRRTKPEDDEKWQTRQPALK